MIFVDGFIQEQNFKVLPDILKKMTPLKSKQKALAHIFWKYISASAEKWCSLVWAYLSTMKLLCIRHISDTRIGTTPLACNGFVVQWCVMSVTAYLCIWFIKPSHFHYYFNVGVRHMKTTNFHNLSFITGSIELINVLLAWNIGEKEHHN